MVAKRTTQGSYRIASLALLLLICSLLLGTLLRALPGTIGNWLAQARPNEARTVEDQQANADHLAPPAALTHDRSRRPGPDDRPADLARVAGQIVGHRRGDTAAAVAATGSGRTAADPAMPAGEPPSADGSRRPQQPGIHMPPDWTNPVLPLTGRAPAETSRADSSVMLAQAVAETDADAPSRTEQAERLDAPSGTPPASPSDQADQLQAPTTSDLPPDDPRQRSLQALRLQTVSQFQRALESGLYGGYESSYLWAHSQASSTVELSDRGASRSAVTESAAPAGTGGRVWLGVRAGERGFRASYWFTSIDALAPGTTDTALTPLAFRGNNHLNANAFDLEVCQPFHVLGSDLELTAGARRVNYRSVDSLLGYAEHDPGIEVTSIANRSRTLSALGFTGSLQGRHPIHSQAFYDLLPLQYHGDELVHGQCSRTLWYWSTRAAVLWGQSEAASISEASVALNDDPAGHAFARSRDHAMASSDSESMLGAWELQVGIEHRRPMRVLAGELVLRAGLEYRRWSLGRVGAESRSFAFLEDDAGAFGGRAEAHAASTDPRLRMFGLTFAAGFNF